MSKTTATYWNVFNAENQHHWAAVQGLEGMVEELIRIGLNEECRNFRHDRTQRIDCLPEYYPQPPQRN